MGGGPYYTIVEAPELINHLCDGGSFVGTITWPDNYSYDCSDGTYMIPI